MNRKMKALGKVATGNGILTKTRQTVAIQQRSFALQNPVPWAEPVFGLFSEPTSEIRYAFDTVQIAPLAGAKGWTVVRAGFRRCANHHDRTEKECVGIDRRSSQYSRYW
jgi:hypothetical protein